MNELPKKPKTNPTEYDPKSFEGHSSGPWRACSCGKCGLIWEAEGEYVIAHAVSREDETITLGEGVNRDSQMFRANMALAAAAPTLLAERNAFAERVKMLEKAALALEASGVLDQHYDPAAHSIHDHDHVADFEHAREQERAKALMRNTLFSGEKHGGKDPLS